jgi:hypothetical protein
MVVVEGKEKECADADAEPNRLPMTCMKRR